MSSILPHQIEVYLRPFYDGDERLGVLLSYCVGRVMLRSAKAGKSWERLTRDEDIHHITDWLKAAVVNDEPWLNNLDDRGRPKKLMKFSSIEDITKEANKAMLKAAQRLSNVKLIDGDEELYAELQDGFYVVRLLTPAALDRESAQMQHCIGDGAYDADLAKPHCLYLSLRDKHGKPHATLEIKHGTLIQLQGKQNTIPTDKYLDILVPFLKTTGWPIDIPACILGHVIDVNGDWYKLNHLPDGLTVGGDLDLYRTKITHLPDGLKVGGRLNLRNTSTTHLPEGLTVGGYLDLQNTKITHLPEGLTVGGWFSLYGTEITEFPDGLTVGGNLFLQGAKIKHLPEGLKVGGYVDLRDSKVTELPDSLSPDTIIYIEDGKMTAEEFRRLESQTNKILC